MGRFFGWMVLLLGLLGAAGGHARQPAPPGATTAADVVLVPGPATLPVTGTFTLGFRLRGRALEQYSEFPELEGFKKNGKTRTVATHIVQGRRFTDLTITQRYVPYGEGEHVIKPYQLTVNGVVLKGGGATVRVGPAPPGPARPAGPGAPRPAVGRLDQLRGQPKPAQFEELPDQVALAVVAERPRVFVGEGVRVGLFLYLAPADQAALEFYDFNDQLSRMLRQMHQPTAWQAPGPAPSVTPDTIRRNGQLFLRFRLAEYTYYPLTEQALRFPPLALTMLKYRFLKKPTAGQSARLPGYKTYLAPGLTVQVEALPPHPQREGVPVGQYQLRESLSAKTVRVGQSVSYTFGIEGSGNLAAVLAPTLLARPSLGVYGPEVREAPAPGGGRKLFRYRLVPHRPGPVPLDSLLQLIVFNPATARYDTLRPTLKLVAKGKAAAPVATARPADDPFYGPALAGASTTLQSVDVYRDVHRYANWLLAALALLAGVGWWRAGRRQ